MPGELPRLVIREHSFDDELRVLIPGAREADTYAEAAEFVLARNPQIGMPSATPGVWFLTMAPISGQQVALLYAFDAETVWLLGIRPF